MNAALLATLGTLSLAVLKIALTPAVGWITVKLGGWLSAHTDKARAEHKGIQIAQAEESLGRFALLGLNSVASTVKADLDAGKSVSAIAADAALASKKFVTDNAMNEIKELLGIATAGLDVKLTAIATSKLQAVAAVAGSAPNSPTVPAAK
jgi:hypothetical protein